MSKSKFPTSIQFDSSYTENFWLSRPNLPTPIEDPPQDQSDRENFLRAVRNFNLDTGFAPRVYSNPWKIYIRHDHSWSVLLDKPKAYDPENPPD